MHGVPRRCSPVLEGSVPQRSCQTFERHFADGLAKNVVSAVDGEVGIHEKLVTQTSARSSI